MLGTEGAANSHVLIGAATVEDQDRERAIEHLREQRADASRRGASPRSDRHYDQDTVVRRKHKRTPT